MAEVARLSQGDVLSRVVLARHHLPNPILVDGGPDGWSLTAAEQAVAPSAAVRVSEQAPVLAQGLLCEAAILSQTCDLRHAGLDSVTVAPVLPISMVPEADRELCAADRIVNYLPLISPPHTYADLSWVCVIAKSSLASARVIAHLAPRDVERLRLKLSIMLGRPALPDEVVADLRLVRNAIADLRRPDRELILGAFVAWDGAALDLLIVTRTEVRPTRLANAVQRWLDEPGTVGIARTARIVSSAGATLAMLDGYARLALDYLSFPLRMEEA